MMPKKIWDFWSAHYEKLWAQRFALKPARDMIISHIEKSCPSAVDILDLGCGVGQLAYELANKKQSYRIVAVDTSSKMIDLARINYKHENIEYQVASIDTLEHDRTYDLIVSTHAFPYFPNKSMALSKMRSILRPGGRLLMVQATIENLYDMVFMLFVRCTVSHAHYKSTRQLSTMIRNAGFDQGLITPMRRLAIIPSIYMVEGIRPIKDSA